MQRTRLEMLTAGYRVRGMIIEHLVDGRVRVGQLGAWNGTPTILIVVEIDRLKTESLSIEIFLFLWAFGKSH